MSDTAADQAQSSATPATDTAAALPPGLRAWSCIKVTDPAHPAAGRVGVVLAVDAPAGFVEVRIDADAQRVEEITVLAAGSFEVL